MKGCVYGKKDAKALIVFSHGIMSGPNEYMMIIDNLVSEGYRVMTYSYTGYNGSEGKWSKGLANSMLDLNSALDFVDADSELSKYPLVLMGHSWGAYATVSVLKFGHPVKAAISFSSFNEPMEMTIAGGEKMIGKVADVMYPFLASTEYFYFGKNYNVKATDSINKANIPVLLVHGKEDDFIEIDKTATFGKKDEIKNKKVEYYLVDRKGGSGHNDYFGVLENNKYFGEKTKELEKIKKENGGKLPKGKKAEVAKTYDYEKLTTIDPDFFKELTGFLDRALK